MGKEPHELRREIEQTRSELGGARVDHRVAERYGVWVEKQLYGRRYLGVERATFLIDGAGTVRRAWRKVSVKGHAAEVLAAVQTL